MLCAATWWFVWLYNSNTFIISFSFIVKVILPELANYPKLSTQANYYSIFGLNKRNYTLNPLLRARVSRQSFFNADTFIFNLVLNCWCNVQCGYWLESNVFVVCSMWSVVRESNFLTSLGLVKLHHSIRSIYRERNTTPKTDSHFDSFSRQHLYPNSTGTKTLPRINMCSTR